jgi:adenine-specific DNA-methyltransferase
VQKNYIDIVDKIISINKSTDYPKHIDKQLKVKEYEKQIDRMVYKLYNLNEEEIEIVEKNLND